MVERHQGSPERLVTGLYELDRVFGGGIVFGSVSLVGGQPGIGKSTILTQMLINVLMKNDKVTVLYLAGEESPEQIAHRIKRIVGESANDQKSVLSRFGLSTMLNVDALVPLVQEKKPDILVVDSIQTVYTEDLTGIAGSVGQLREAALRLVALAKQQRIPVFLVGHVTKEGEIAGPKVLEHIVDTVIEISGERSGEIRVVRSLKNRFGPTDEVGLFRFAANGMEEVSNPADVFLEKNSLNQAGSALAVCLEGSRPVVVEVQALVVPSYLPTPRRISRGINVSKVHMLLAVLQKHAKVNLSTDDVYVSLVGNLEFRDPGIDLAVAAALLSAKKGKPLGDGLVYCGEIGLLGEVRRVIGLEKRIKEAKRLGYKSVVTAQTLPNVRSFTL
jgi:DNA repair protein RadA/Sms